MSESPLLSLLLFAGALYLLKLWLDDYRTWQSGNPSVKALPGATSVSATALVIASIGAIFLVAVETAGEYALGVSEEQSQIAVLFLLPMLGAGVLEEILFRGYLVVTARGRTVLALSCVLFSALFALLHYQYYLEIPEEGSIFNASLDLNAKSLWSLLLLFLNSLWFYAVRFATWNPNRSLLPCFVAHISSNLAVFLVKAAQGHVTGWITP
jgi:hypothetical protein